MGGIVKVAEAIGFYTLALSVDSWDARNNIKQITAHFLKEFKQKD